MSAAPSYAPNAFDWAGTGYTGSSPANGTSGSFQVPPAFGNPQPGGDMWNNYFGQGFAPQAPDAAARAQQAAQALWAAQIQAGPQFAMNQLDRDSILGSIAGQTANYGIESNYLTGSNANQLAQLGLKEQGIGIDQAAIGRKGDYLTNIHNIAGQVFDLQGKEAWQTAGKEQRSTRSAAIAAGGNTSIGLNQSMTDIADQLTNRGQEIDLSRQKETAQFNEDFAANTDAGKQLDLQAQSLGIDRNQLALDLKTGLDRLGLSNSVTLADLFRKMQSSNIQDAILAQQIYNAVYSASDAAQTSPSSGTSGTFNQGGAGGGSKYQ